MSPFLLTKEKPSGKRKTCPSDLFYHYQPFSFNKRKAEKPTTIGCFLRSKNISSDFFIIHYFIDCFFSGKEPIAKPSLLIRLLAQKGCLSLAAAFFPPALLSVYWLKRAVWARREIRQTRMKCVNCFRTRDTRISFRRHPHFPKRKRCVNKLYPVKSFTIAFLDAK